MGLIHRMTSSLNRPKSYGQRLFGRAGCRRLPEFPYSLEYAALVPHTIRAPEGASPQAECIRNK